MAEWKDRIRVHVAGQEYNIVGGDFQQMLAAVKQINGRRFVSELKVWQLPGTVEDIQRQLDISGYRLEGGKPVGSSPAPAAPAARQAAPRPAAGQAGGDKIRVLVEGRWLAVVGGDFQDMLAMVKGLPGRRFNIESKVWEIPGEVAVVKGMIESAGFQLEGAENVSIGPVPPMESLDFLGQGPDDIPPFEGPDFFDQDSPPEVPDWWDDDLAPPPTFDSSHLASPPSFDEEPDPFLEQTFTEPVRPSIRPGGDRIRIRLGQVPLVVTGGSFQQMLSVIKDIPGRRFNGDDKVWEFPDEVGLETVQQAVHAAGFEVRPEE